jgi:hypothetical protein
MSRGSIIRKFKSHRPTCFYDTSVYSTRDFCAAFLVAPYREIRSQMSEEERKMDGTMGGWMDDRIDK